MARLKPVLQAKGRSLPGERIGKLLFNLLCSPPLQYVFPAQSQCRTLGLIQLFLPSLEVAGTDNFSWNPLIIKLEQYLWIHQEITTPGLGFQLIHLMDLLLVMMKEVRPGIELPFHQSVANKKLPGQYRVNATKADLPATNQHHPIQGHLLIGDHLAPLFLPMGFQVVPLDQMLRRPLDPLGFDPRHSTGIHLGRFDNLRCQNPFGCFFEQARARVDEELPPAGPQVFALLVLKADQGDIAAENGTVDQLKRAWLSVFLQPKLLADQTQLPVQVAPLTHSQKGQELFFTKGSQLIGTEFLALLLEIIPEINQAQEVGVFILPNSMAFVSLLLFIQGPLPWIRDSQGACNNQDLPQATQARRLQQHPSDPGICGNSGHLPPQLDRKSTRLNSSHVRI